MKLRRLFIAVALVLLSATARAQEWAAYGTISAEPTPGRICAGHSNGKDIVCASPAPHVDASGNVGIGTATPAYNLHIQSGTLGIINSGNHALADAIYFANPEYPTTYRNKIQSAISGDIFVPAKMIFSLSIGPSSYTDVLSLLGDGNVGIGTTSPAEKLEVAGNIKASGTLQVANSAATCTGAADYGKFRYNPVNGKLQICKP